ncbi:MAG: 30S ribosomal protein S6 [Bryobacteraceae bacterium]|nr:30S ribosomal protein S6 [Bryobacteraceae bacterium]
MRLYEEVFIVKPDATDEDANGVVEQLSKTVTDQGGKIEKVDPWGRRKLAYKVLKYEEGNFFIVTFSAKAETVKEVERRLRVNDLVIKFLTVRLDEKLKWVEKRKKRREERAKRKPPVASVIPAVPGLAPAIPGAPGAPVPAAPMPAAPLPGKPPASEAELAPVALEVGEEK